MCTRFVEFVLTELCTTLPPKMFGAITTLVHAETGMKWNHSDGVKSSICFHGQRLNEPLESEENVL